MTELAPIRVLRVDDHLVVRMGLSAVLREVPRLQIVGEAEDVAGAVERFTELRPDVVLMDLRLPGGGGIEALKLIREEFPAAKVVMFTTYDFEEDIHRALQAGAVGYLLKNISSGELAAALVSAHEKGVVELSADVSARLAERDGAHRARAGGAGIGGERADEQGHRARSWFHPPDGEGACHEPAGEAGGERPDRGHCGGAPARNRFPRLTGYCPCGQ